MPAYSPTPLAQKLGFKDGTRYWFIKAPLGFENELPTLPPTAKPVPPRSVEIDLILFFASTHKVLVTHLPALIPKLPADGILWIAWAKKTSGVITDLNENLVRETLLETGLVDIKVCSINETFSGLKFVRRRKDRRKFDAERA